MVSGSGLGVTPEPHSATTGALTGVTGCGPADAEMREKQRDCTCEKQEGGEERKKKKKSTPTT